MPELSYEIGTALLILLFVVLLSAEYIWLFILSKKNEETDMQKREINNRIHGMIEAYMYSPTEASREAELSSLFDYIGDDKVKKDEAAVQFIQLLRRSDDIPPEKAASLGILLERLQPVEFYKEQLQKGSRYEKSYAARRLGDFMATDCIEDIRELLKDKHKDAQYNAAMALAELNDAESVIYFLKENENNRNYSFRLFLELLQSFHGDRVALVRRLYEECGNYVKGLAVRAYTPDRYEELADLYVEGMLSKDPKLQVSCVKAVAQLGNPIYQQKLATALNDKNWIVRLSAVSGLEKIGTDSAIELLVKATQDEEWWVRNAAAQSIVNIDEQLVHVEQILSGYDKGAADAIKNALYKQINMNRSALR